MKLIVREGDIPKLSPLTFAIELPDELGEKFSPEFLRMHFSKSIMAAYFDLYIIDSEECIDRINASVWEIKRNLLNFYVDLEKNRG